MSCKAIHIGGPNDQGIDILLIDSERQYVIQVKRRRSSSSTEGVFGTREFLGAMMLNGAVNGLFVSTASRFSKQAEAATEKAAMSGLVEKIALVNSARLLEVCRLTASHIKDPWVKAKSKRENFIDNIHPGFTKFMELAMGSSKWRVARRKSGPLPNPDVIQIKQQ